MPELPEVETIRRGLTGVLVGRRLVRVVQRRADLRVPIPAGFAARLTGRRVTAVRRRGKYLLVDCDGGLVMLGHLGMSGRLVVAAPPVAPGPHDHLLFETDDGPTVVFHDPRRFGMVDLTTTDAWSGHPRLAALGPEPLADGFTGLVLGQQIAGRRQAIKVTLLDQGVVAGLGNIYVSESLYRSGILPTRPAGSLSTPEVERLATAIRTVLTEAIAAGGSSLRDYQQVSGELGYFQHRFAVYDRAGSACPTCDCDIATTGGIARAVQGNRATFYCPRRQR